jgi:FkbM family methyltransferase
LDDDYQIGNFMLDRGARVVLDVGANIGMFSLAVANRFPEADIYAFEPSPEAYPRLAENVKLNGSSNVKPVNRAVYSSSSVLGFSDSRSTTSAHITETGPTLVQAVTLDDFCIERGICRVGLLKIDVEGAELEVLKGANRTLAFTDSVVTECHSERLAKEVVMVLGKYGFRMMSDKRLPHGGGVFRFRRDPTFQ